MSSFAKTTPELDAAVLQALTSEWATELLDVVRAVAHQHLTNAGFWVMGLIQAHIRAGAIHEARWCGLHVHDPVSANDFRVMVDLSLRIDSVIGEDCRITLLAQQEQGEAAFSVLRLVEFALPWPEMALAPSRLPARLAGVLLDSVDNKLSERCHQGGAAFAKALTESLAA